jgi:hypothetical protein
MSDVVICVVRCSLLGVDSLLVVVCSRCLSAEDDRSRACCALVMAK